MSMDGQYVISRINNLSEKDIRNYTLFDIQNNKYKDIFTLAKKDSP